LDFIDIDGAIPLTSNGATLTYFELEAEDADHNGVVIGPNITYLSLPSEASSRKAVQLQTGQSVTFTLTASANAIVVRFSIPDSSDGNGQTGSVGVSVNGQQVLTLPTTSKFSWTYGTYPFTNNPSDGNGHHFYDDTRGMFSSTLASGTKVTVTPLSGPLHTIDLADFYVVPAPYSQPANSLDITTYGADPTGKADSTQQFLKAIQDGTSKGQVVWVPQGLFSVNQIFQGVNNVTIRGAGPWYSTVQATVAHGVGFFGSWGPPSQNVQLYDFAIFGDTVYRDDSAADSGTGGAMSNSLIQNLWIEHTKCGMWLDGPFDSYHVTGVTIRNQWADGVNFHRGVTNSIVEQSILRNTGDDSLAMWPDSSPESKNVFKFNTITVPVFANGLAIYGGSDHQLTDNYIADTVCEGSGIQVGNRFNSGPLGGTITIARNTIVRSGTKNRANDAHSGSYWFWADQQPITANIVVTDSTVLDSSWTCITFWGSTINNVTFSNLTFTGATYAAEVGNLAGQAVTLTGASFFTNTVASQLQNGGISSCDTNFAINQGTGCTGWSDVDCNMVCDLTKRNDCGFSGITQQECESKGCCYYPVDPNPGNVPWCFYKVINATQSDLVW